MRNQQKKILLVFISTFFILNIQAQVTIGSTETPINGALLDLKESGTTKRGLGLPRVALTNLTPKNDVELAASMGAPAGSSYSLTQHVGLLVYNTTKCLKGTGTDNGLYVWAGTEWQKLEREEGLASVVYTVTDNRDNNTYLARNFGTAGDWMLENLRYIDGSFTPSTASDGVTTKAYFYPQLNGGTQTNPTNIKTWEEKQGLLYTYSAATMGKQDAVSTSQAQISITPVAEAHEVEKQSTLDGPDSNGEYFIQGICPTGWHIPSDREWNELEKEIYEHPELYSTYNSVNDFNPTSWNSNWLINTGTRGSNGAGHNLAMQNVCPAKGFLSKTVHGKSKKAKQGGFDAMLVGYGSLGQAAQYSFLGYCWSSSIHDANTAYIRSFENGKGELGRPHPDNGIYSTYKQNLYSVRCKKND